MTAMKNRALWIILAGAVVLRGTLLVAGWGRTDRFFTPDSHDYAWLARNLSNIGQFTRTGGPELFRTPGYPLLLAGVFKLTGGSVRAAVGVGIALDVVLCLLVYLLGRELAGKRVGLLAAAIQAVSPVAVVASVRLLSSATFALLVTAALLLLVRRLKGGRAWLAPVAGALAGLGCLVRPIGLPFVIIGALALLSRPKQWYLAVAFAGAAAAVVGPWIARNYVRAGYPQLAGVSDYNLFYCNAAAIREVHPDIPLDKAQIGMFAQPAAYGPAWPPATLLNEPDFLRDCRRNGIALIREHPWTYAGVHLRATPNVFLPAATDVLEVLGVTAGGKGTLAVARRRGPIAAMRHYFGDDLWALWLCVPMLLVTGLKYLAAVVFLVRGQWRRGGAVTVLVGLTVVYFVLAPGPVAHPRFRVPIAPLISIAAAAGVCWITARLISRRRACSSPE